jgi:hypothetical protein
MCSTSSHLALAHFHAKWAPVRAKKRRILK